MLELKTNSWGNLSPVYRNPNDLFMNRMIWLVISEDQKKKKNTKKKIIIHKIHLE